MDTEKIKIMTRLAAYQKNEARRDGRISAYFMHDYVCARNMQTRICVFFGCLNIAALNALYRFFYLGEDPLSLDYAAELKKAALYVAPVLLAYTVLGGIKAGAEYLACQKRLAEKAALIDKLNAAKPLPPPPVYGDDGPDDPYLYREPRRPL